MDDTAAVRRALDALYVALERRDLDAVLDLCTEDIVFIGSGDGEEAVGREAIGPMFLSLAPHLEDAHLSLAWESVDVTVLGHVAVLVAFGAAELVTRTREETLRYRLTGVLVRQDERWLWRLYHGSEPGEWAR